jgi:hypothetical protein
LLADCDACTSGSLISTTAGQPRKNSMIIATGKTISARSMTALPDEAAGDP